MEGAAGFASVSRMIRRSLLGLGLSFVLACGEDELTTLDAGPNPPGADAATPGPDAATGADAVVGPDATPPADAGPVIDPEVGRIDLGPVELANGVSAELGFELPAELSTFTVVLRGQENAMYVVQRLEGPGGLLVNDQLPQEFLDFLLGPFPSQYKSPNRVVAQREGISAALFPNNPNVSVGPGSYSMRVAGVRTDSQQTSPATGTVQVEVLYKRGSIATGKLEVGLYFTGAGGLSAASAPTSPLMNDALAKLRSVYAQANVEITGVSYYDVSSSFSTISNLAGPNNQLNELFKLSQAGQRGLHFFFVDRIESPLGGVIGGVAGGLPGPPGGQGTTGAGVAVALSAANGDANLLGHVMAHEGGHWLGLSHTTELLLQGVEDQLPDTPSGQAGTSNMMYPDGSSTGSDVSAQQAEVMRRHIETLND